jgi:ribose transport system ATP-binding protein
LDNVTFELLPGEVHVLLGENGAGKSTLISLVAGVFSPSSGDVSFRGEKVTLASVHHARSLGISAVFQEFSLIGQLTVEENLFLGAEHRDGIFLNRRALHAEAKKILADLGFPLRAKQRVDHLSRAEQQMVEIAKAFRSDLSVLILDEPTASLTERETERLFALLQQLKMSGVGIIYITHRMGEIRRIGDRVTVLRDGRCMGTVEARTTPEDELVRLMTGRVIDQLFPKTVFRPGAELLRIENLSTNDDRVHCVSLNVRRGEIVGLAGLPGSGKSHVVRACFGLVKISNGRVLFEGPDVTGFSVRQMLDRGFFYNPPDRRAEGLVMKRNCRENITLPSLHLERFQKIGLLRRMREKKIASGLATELQLQPLQIEREVEHFSGGNQQKVLLAKCLTPEVKLYVFDEPTVGVDVGTRVEIYKFISQLCEEGAAVVLVSSDLPEILHLTNRVYVMYRGRVQCELSDAEISQENVLRHFFERDAA